MTFYRRRSSRITGIPCKYKAQPLSHIHATFHPRQFAWEERCVTIKGMVLFCRCVICHAIHIYCYGYCIAFLLGRTTVFYAISFYAYVFKIHMKSQCIPACKIQKNGVWMFSLVNSKQCESINILFNLPALRGWYPKIHEYCALAFQEVDPLIKATVVWGKVTGSPQAMGWHLGSLPVHRPLASHSRVALPAKKHLTFIHHSPFWHTLLLQHLSRLYFVF